MTAANINAPAASVEPVGLGFWLDLAQTQILNITGRAVNNPVGIRLFAQNGTRNPGGWNLIGTPFTFPVDWNSVSVLFNGTAYRLEDAVRQNILKGGLIGYANGDYYFQIAPQGQLQPFNGYWVQALQDCILIVPPAASAGRSIATRSLVPTRAATKDGAGNNGWRVRLQAAVGGDRDGQNFFGTAPGATSGEDETDIAKPPSGAGHAYLRFLVRRPAATATNGASNASSRATSTALAYDLRSSDTRHETWTVAVSADRADADVRLSWDNLAGVPRRSRLMLKDMVTGRLVPLQSRSSYVYRTREAGETRLFEIRLMPEESRGALAITGLFIGDTRGAGAASGVSVRFRVNRDAEATGTLRTLDGKVVAKLNGGALGRAHAGRETTLHWNGRSTDGTQVLPFGPYQVEISVRTPEGDTAQVKRPVFFRR
jgi:hypothetical protein